MVMYFLWFVILLKSCRDLFDIFIEVIILSFSSRVFLIMGLGIKVRIVLIFFIIFYRISRILVVINIVLLVIYWNGV